jgi:DNA-binding MarR family transcriptional regulator
MHPYQKLSFVWAKGNALYIRFANQLGIGYPELMVLYTLVVFGSMTQKEISEYVGLLKPTVNTVVRDLKKRGYLVLEQCRADKRERLVSLTPSGQAYAENRIQPVLQAEAQTYEKIELERIQKMYDTMELFNLLFEKEMEENASR